MSPTNAKTRRHSTTTAFTLVELVVSASLSAILFAGILGGFTFLGRNLTRLVNTQEQDAKSRHAVSIFSQDISKAVQLSTADIAPQLTLVLSLPADTVVANAFYTYDPNVKTLTRTLTLKNTLTGTTTTSSVVLLKNLTTLAFNYFNNAGGSIASGSLGIKEVELSFASALGNAPGGTQACYAVASPRLVLRNKPLLQ